MAELDEAQSKVASRLEQLRALAQARPDLITPGSTGKLENARPYTYAGRVVSALDNETPQSILARVPIQEMESGGQAMGAIPKGLLMAGMAKQFRPAAALTNEEIAARLRAQFESGELRSAAPTASRTIGGKLFRDAPQPVLAPGGATSLSHIEEMYPAYLNTKTGEIYHVAKPYVPGAHKPVLESIPASVRGNFTRGFVDPKTGHTFTEAQMEEQLMNKWFSIRPHP
jgi:hypothetical protein